MEMSVPKYDSFCGKQTAAVTQRPNVIKQFISNNYNILKT